MPERPDPNPEPRCLACGEPLPGPGTEACPACGERGYPGLRPRRGKGWKGPPEEDAEDPLAGVVVVLHEPQDLVNVALVVRAMKNMGLSWLRLVRPAEFDPHRIEGIAHGTEDLIETTERPPDLDAALADATWVVGTTARRRASRQRWFGPEEGARAILRRAAAATGTAAERAEPSDATSEPPKAVDPGGRPTVALLFGREDRGLSNRDLDRCDALIAIPTDPSHPSMNLGHAALLLFWELRKAAWGAALETGAALAPKRRRRSPPATAAEMEAFFEAWERAMEAIGFFHHIDPLPKMRSFRSIFQRAELSRRELGLLQAAAYEILHYARRERLRVRGEAETGGPERDRGEGDG